MFPYPASGTSFSRLPASALATAIVLLAGSLPAAAQDGLGAVVCLGSERQTLEAAGPVRRVIKEDVAVVYRVGVRADDQEGMEQSLLLELGDTAEASCTWSNPGDSYVVIVRYTGAIRHFKLSTNVPIGIEACPPGTAPTHTFGEGAGEDQYMYGYYMYGPAESYHCATYDPQR